MLKVIKLILISASVLVTLNSLAFWSLPIAKEDHSSITMKGLFKYKFDLTNDYFRSITEVINGTAFIDGYDSPSRSFTSSARPFIADANEYIDKAEDKVDDDSFHCDNEKIADCAKNVRNYKSDIINALNAAISESKVGSNNSTDFKLLRTKLGESLHVLQDFYSHSNWVERHIYGTQGKIRLDKNFKKNTLITDVNIPVNTNFFLKDNYFPTLSDGSTCVTGPAWNNDDTYLYNDLFLENLTTGFYKRSNNIYVAKTYPASVLNSDTHKYCNIPSLVSGENYCLINGSKVPLGYATNIIVAKIPGLPLSGLLVSGGYSINTGEVGKEYDGPFFQKNINQIPTGIEKCIHSESIRTHKEAHIGIAKDHKLSLHHKPAFDVAVRATTIYVKTLIDEVIKQNGEGIYTDWAILNFLGYDVKIPNNLNKPNVINIYPYPDTITNNDSVEITMSKGQSTEIIVTFDRAVETASFVNESSSGISMTKIDSKHWKHSIKYNEEGIYFVKINSSSKYASNSYDFKIIVIDNPLETPENLSATRTNANNVDLTWDTVEGADGYNIYIFKNGKNSTGSDIEEIQTTETSLPLVLDKTKTFFVVIEAYNEVKTSDVSGFLEIPATLAPLTLSIPSSLSREEGKNKFVPFTFSPLALKDTVDSVTCSTNPNIGTLLGTPSKQGVSFTAPQANAIPSFTLNCEALSAIGSVLSTSNNLVVTVTQSVVINNQPVAKITTDKSLPTLTEGDSFNLKGGTSTDPDTGDSIASYLWKEGTTTLGTSVNLPLNNIIAGTRTISLTVTDKGDLTNTTEVTFTVKAKANTLPVARITSDTDLTNVFVGDSIVLKGDTSTDAESAIKSYLWEELGQSIGTGSTVTLSSLTLGKYFIKLTVTDFQGGENSKQIIVDAKEKINTAPVASINGNPALPRLQITVNDGETVSLDASSSTDADSDTLTYKWLDVGTGTIFNETISFSKIFAVGVHIVTLQVNDGTVTSEAKVRVEVKSNSSSLISIPLDLNHFNKTSCGNHLLANNQITLSGVGYRQGIGITSISSFNFKGSDTYVKWKAGTNSSYANYNIYLSGLPKDGNKTTNHSFASSTLIANDTWYYTHFKMNNDGSYFINTSRNNYDDNGGVIVKSKNGVLTGEESKFINNTTIMVRMDDNYASTQAELVIGEIKTTAVEIVKSTTILGSYNFDQSTIIPSIFTLSGAWDISSGTSYDGSNTLHSLSTVESLASLDTSGLSRISFKYKTNISTEYKGFRTLLDNIWTTVSSNGIDGCWLNANVPIDDATTDTFSFQLTNSSYSNENVEVFIDDVILYSDGTTATGKLNDTGITKCADDNNNDLACPVSTHPNQDAQIGRDATNNNDSDGHAGFSFTKISSTGAELPASATEWSCVKDNVTGLTWEKQNKFMGQGFYTWYNSDDLKNGGDKGSINEGRNTEEYIRNINSEGLCGKKDWRLPNIKELRSIVDYSTQPTIDRNFFNTSYTWHWTSSTAKNSVKTIYFGYGIDVFLPKDYLGATFLSVTGNNIPIKDLQDNGNGTIKDNTTGLIWKKCLEGQNWNQNDNSCENMPIFFTWGGAFRHAVKVNKGLKGENLGQTNWRVPNVKELSSIYEAEGTIDWISNANFFPELGNKFYWSSSTSLNGYHSSLEVGGGSNARLTELNLRLVRTK